MQQSLKWRTTHDISDSETCRTKRDIVIEVINRMMYNMCIKG